MVANKNLYYENWIALFIGALAITGGAVLGVLASRVDPALAVLGLIGAIIVVVTFFKIELGLYGLIIMTYVNLSDVLITYHGAPSVAKFFVPFLLGVVILRALIFKDRLSNAWQLAALLLFVYSIIVFSSLIYGTDFARSQTGLTDFVKDALIVIVVAMLMTRGVVLRGVIWCLLFSGIFMGTITTYQQLTGTFTNSYWGFAVAESSIIGAGTTARIAGPLSSNFYALILVVLVPLAIDRLWHEKTFILRFFALWALTVTVLSIFFTFSRGGFLSLLVVLGLTVTSRPYRSRPDFLLIIVILGLGFLQLVPPVYLDRIQSLLLFSSQGSSIQLDDSFRGRLSENLVAIQMFADHPITGAGYYNYEANYLKYSSILGIDPRAENRQPHNAYLEVAAETGILGITIFGTILWIMFKGLNQAKHDFQAAELLDYYYMTKAFGIGFIGYLAGSVFLHMAYQRYFWLLIGIGLSIPYIAKYELDNVKKQKPVLIDKDGVFSS